MTSRTYMSVSVFFGVSPLCHIIIMVAQIAIFSITNFANCLFFTRSRASTMSDSTTCFFFSTYRANVPMVRIVMLKHAKVVFYLSYVSAVASGIASITKDVFCFTKLLSLTTGTTMPVIISIVRPAICFIMLMSKCWRYYPPTYGTRFRSSFGCRARRSMCNFFIGYGASVLRTYVPMSSFVLLPLSTKVVFYLSCIPTIASGVASVAKDVFCYVKSFLTASTAVPVMGSVIRPVIFFIMLMI